MCVTKNVMVQKPHGWFGAYPEKQYAFHDLAETVDTVAETVEVAVPIIATKQPINSSIPTARGWIMRLMTSAYKICDHRDFEICFHVEFYFYPFSVYLQAKHDSFCA